LIYRGHFFSAVASVGASAVQRSPPETRALLMLGGDALEQETFIIVLMILVIGYIISIKK